MGNVEGVHFSSFFKNLIKKLSCVVKQWVTLKFQLHRVFEKFIEGHISVENTMERETLNG